MESSKLSLSQKLQDIGKLTDTPETDAAERRPSGEEVREACAKVCDNSRIPFAWELARAIRALDLTKISRIGKE